MKFFLALEQLAKSPENNLVMLSMSQTAKDSKHD